MNAASPPSMTDWLKAHGLTVRACADLLAMQPPVPGSVAAAPAPTDWPQGPALWSVIASALAEAWPELAPEIAQTAAETVVNFAPDRTRHPRPFALFIEEKSMVYVSCPLSQKAEDLVRAVHEFGHALQLHCIAGRPLSPVLRETCAILAEEMLPQALARRAPEWAAAASAVLVRYRARNLGAMRRELQAALGVSETSYDYRWNYPCARILALYLLEGSSADRRRALFHGRTTVSELIEKLHA